MVTFQRARSEEQREVRRRAILDAAAAMLTEMPVAEVTLNELSRRAGLAKSNVLRYFESREAVLLVLLDSAWRDWLAQLAGDLGQAVDAGAPVAARGDQLATALADSLAERPGAVRPARRPVGGAGAQRLGRGGGGLQAGRAGRRGARWASSCSSGCPSWVSPTRSGSRAPPC